MKELVSLSTNRYSGTRGCWIDKENNIPIKSVLTRLVEIEQKALGDDM
jgi:phage gp46-like protein